MRDFLKKHRNLLISFLVVLICGVVAFSTAYIIEINSDGIIYSTKGKAKSGDPNITFTAENTRLSIENAYPVSDLVGIGSTPYTFSVTNNETKYNVSYEIYLETKDGTSGYLSDSLVKFSLKDSQSSGTILGNLTSSSPTLSSDGYTKAYLIATGVVANTKYPTDSSEESISYTNYVLNEETLNTTKNYNMRLWIAESATVESSADKTWTGKLVIKYNYELPDENQSITDTIFTGYTEVAYLQSSGHQWINTTYTPNASDDFYLEVTPTSTAQTGTFWCARTDMTSNTFTLFAINGTNFRFDHDITSNSQILTTNNPIVANNKYIIETKNNNLYINATSIGTYTSKNFTAGNYVSIFSSYTQNLDNNRDNYLYAKLYYFQIKNNNTIKLKLVPCVRNSDSKPGLCDTISQTFYSNQGTGEFGYETLDGTIVSPI